MEPIWEQEEEHGVSEPTLVIDVQGFEGPLDLLLQLARNQKVDLAHISIVELVQQYLDFVKTAHELRLDLAADYLVMAAWLAYLKSRLLVPQRSDDEGESGEELAGLLQFRLQRLEAMREAAGQLVNRNRLGRDVFKRANPEMVVVEKKHLYDVSLYDLLMAYAGLRQRQAVKRVEVGKREVWSLKAARAILVRLMGEAKDWQALDKFLFAFIPTAQERRTALASTFAASLEMVREKQLDIRQAAPFAPIYLRAHKKTEGEQKTVNGDRAEQGTK
ncbi:MULTISPECIES: ScpA family protein [Bartonella]|uniref:Segregation and condensation protein A n=1 Tax=Bartonella choladocola TaxID=2750995 RepID=A0A1U9MGD1_9HYPH|nr:MULTISPECIES: ScpA family protein [Bartonella]AQT47027.1 condensin subunit ScpA [Bartonella choladocola]MBH9975195.1 segregation/condensation protein A [Bartonella choladocola]MBI0014801.1 segregation/condensation protein A [Bartonella sp. B10834G3]MBI0140379.1 segregation/condensation protein A [Bartonella choladocola]